MPEQTFTIDDLTRLLHQAAGADATEQAGGDIHDITFTDLGYDSLALLETSSRIEREWGVSLDDDTVTAAPTPRALLAEVNARLNERRLVK